MMMVMMMWAVSLMMLMRTLRRIMMMLMMMWAVSLMMLTRMLRMISDSVVEDDDGDAAGA